jgi:diguanylate cyclase (GGDEF)-like protein
VRYGGDEFIVLLPRRSQPEALEITRRLRHSLNHTAFLHNEGLRVKITASYGIATMPEDAQDRETLLFIADQALFSSKGRGRDRIMLARDLMAESEGWHAS